MPSTTRNVPAKSGITTTEDGERHIPSSTRSDGTVRKEIRVRPGYRPPEDVEVYQNRTANAFRSRGSGGVPGFDYSTVAKPKSSKPRPPKKERVESDSAKTAGESPADSSTTMVSSKDGVLEEPLKLDPEAEKEKNAKKLIKKLRQAKDLQQKKEKGDALLPEQFEKVIRINELIRQLDNLGFKPDGERKI